MLKVISTCRLCGAASLPRVIDLGDFRFTGVFPLPRSSVGGGPLCLVRCGTCGLVQLEHEYDARDLYGEHYGYRSGLNPSMVRHLSEAATALAGRVGLGNGDIALDIGCSDGTFLAALADRGALLTGFDPSAGKFQRFHPPGLIFIEDFFSAAAFRERFPNRQAKLITSIAMFYDLAHPLEFAREVATVLADDGLWHLEQSYLPLMLETNAYDTICHEHTEYYALEQIDWIMRRAGLSILDVQLNDVNGGSFAVTVSKGDTRAHGPVNRVAHLLERENALKLDTGRPFRDFMRRVEAQRKEFRETLERLRTEGQRVFGYGASTKGNVILQYCGITPDLVQCIAEINPDKFGHETPGTRIPIVSEAEARAQRPNYFLVLPWHFRRGIVAREQSFLSEGGRLIFPLPALEICSAASLVR